MIRIARRNSIVDTARSVTIVDSFHAIVSVISDSMGVAKEKTKYPVYSAHVEGTRDFLTLDLDGPAEKAMLRESGLTRITYPSYTKGSFHMLLELSRPLKDSEWSDFAKTFKAKYGVRPHSNELFEPCKAPITVYTGKSVQVDEMLASIEISNNATI